jgi:hypothetical protein
LNYVYLLNDAATPQEFLNVCFELRTLLILQLHVASLSHFPPSFVNARPNLTSSQDANMTISFENCG